MLLKKTTSAHVAKAHGTARPAASSTPRQRSRPLPATGQSSDSATVDEAASRCPVLSALKPLPTPPMHPLKRFAISILDPIGSTVRAFDGGQPIVRSTFLGFPMVMLGHADAMKELYSHEMSNAVSVGWPPATTELMGSEAVSVATDPEHHRALRQLLAPALSEQAVDTYLPDIQALSRGFLDDVVAESAGSTAVLLVPKLKTFFLDLISKTVIGLELNKQEVEDFHHDFITWSKALFAAAPVDAWPFPFHESMKARKRIVARIQPMISKIRAEFESGGEAGSQAGLQRRSVLRRFLESRDEQGNGLTDKQIIDNVVNILFAGHDSTTSYLSSSIFNLGLYPEVLQRLREEQARVVAVHGEAFTAAALKDMPYTAAFLAETNRKRPVILGVLRLVNQDIGNSGYQLTKNDRVFVHLGHMAKSDPRWPAQGDPASNPLHPDNFNPDRFLTPEGAEQGWLFPFSAASRTCLGISLAQAELKIMTALLARHYDFTVDTDTVWRATPIDLPDNQLPVVIKHRAPVTV